MKCPVADMATNASIIDLFCAGDDSVARRLVARQADAVWTRFVEVYGDDQGDAAEFFIAAVSLRRNWKRMSKTPTKQLEVLPCASAETQQLWRTNFSGMLPT